MNFRRLLTSGSLAIVAACINPSDTCACTPPIPMAIIHGTITRAGTPSPEYVIVNALEEGCEMTNANERVGFVARTADADGEYRVTLHLNGLEAATKCVVVEVPTLEGPVYSPGTLVEFRLQRPLDSAEVNVDVPGPNARPSVRLSP